MTIIQDVIRVLSLEDNFDGEGHNPPTKGSIIRALEVVDANGLDDEWHLSGCDNEIDLSYENQTIDFLMTVSDNIDKNITYYGGESRYFKAGAMQLFKGPPEIQGEFKGPELPDELREWFSKYYVETTIKYKNKESVKWEKK